jgi:DNA-binding NarL/FixJ family response regulator
MHRLKTYLVEDSAVIRDSLIATLQELTPVRVVGVAEDQATATRWLADPGHQAALVIIDIFLKRGSGLGVLQACAAVQPDRKMVVLSNYATPDMRRKCLDLGADRVFDKSTEIDALVAYSAGLAAGGVAISAPAALT